MLVDEGYSPRFTLRASRCASSAQRYTWQPLLGRFSDEPAEKDMGESLSEDDLVDGERKAFIERIMAAIAQGQCRVDAR